MYKMTSSGSDFRACFFVLGRIFEYENRFILCPFYGTYVLLSFEYQREQRKNLS